MRKSMNSRQVTGVLPLGGGRGICARFDGGSLSRRLWLDGHPQPAWHQRVVPRMLGSLLQQLGDKRRPSGLMAGADARTRIPVEVLVEGDQIPPMRIVLEQIMAAEHGAPAGIIHEKNRGQAS